MVAQHDQIEKLDDHVGLLNRQAEDAKSKTGQHSDDVGDQDRQLAELWRAAGLSRPSAEELERVPIDPDLLLSDREMQEIRQRLPDLSLGLNPPDADGDWDAYMREVYAYIERHAIDVDRDPLTQLLQAGRAAEVIRQFDEDYGPTPWDKWDWGVIGFAVVAGSLLDYFLVATPGNAFKGVPQRASPVTAWLREQSEKLAPMAGTDGLQRNTLQQWVAGLPTKAEAWAKVPYDLVRPGIDLTPNTHRVAAIGHDPVLGLVFGAKGGDASVHEVSFG